MMRFGNSASDPREFCHQWVKRIPLVQLLQKTHLSGCKIICQTTSLNDESENKHAYLYIYKIALH